MWIEVYWAPLSRVVLDLQIYHLYDQESLDFSDLGTVSFYLSDFNMFNVFSRMSSRNRSELAMDIFLAGEMSLIPAKLS